MKKIRISLLSCLLLLCISSCLSEEKREEQSFARKMNISCAIQEGASKASATGFEKGDVIGLYIVDYVAGAPQELSISGNHADNVKFSFNGSVWNSGVDLYWYSKESADAYGYYPYIDNIDDVTSLRHTIQHRQDTDSSSGSLSGYERSDFLYAKSECVPSGSMFMLNFKHVMSLIRLTLAEGEGFNEGQWAALEKAIIVENTRSGAIINLQNGNIVTDENSDVTSIIPWRGLDSWTCVVVPQTIVAGTILFNISINGELYEFRVPETTSFLSGKQSSYTIRVNQRESKTYEFQLVAESITPWHTDDTVRNHDSRAYISVNVTYFGGLQSALDEMGIDYSAVSNLKVDGKCGEEDFTFIKSNLKNLNALSLVDATLENDAIPYQGLGDYSGTKISYIAFPSSLKRIENQAFKNTPLNQRLFLPEGLTYIGESAFDRPNDFYLGGITEQGNTNILGVSLPSSLRHIGERAFANASIGHELVLPDDIAYIGEAAFDNCRYVSGNLHIPSKLTSIEARAFSTLLGTSGILDIPATVESIGFGSFASTGFTGLVLHEGLKYIGEAAFAGVYFGGMPNSSNYNEYDIELSRMGLNARIPHPYGGYLTIPTTVQHIGKYAFANTAFTHVHIPDNFEELPEGLFAYCTEMADTVRIPSHVSHLSSKVFQNCVNLKAVILPENLLSISESCFSGCLNLNYIKCQSPTPPSLEGYGHFDGVAKNNFTLLVPEGSASAYRNAPGWSEFKRISEYRDFVTYPQFAKCLNKSSIRKVLLYSDAPWTVNHIPDWVHISQTQGDSKTELTVTIDELASGVGNRADSIVFQLNDCAYTTCYEVVQYDSQYSEDKQQILQKSSKGKGINLVIIGDGYDAADINSGLYEIDMKQTMEYFFGVEPYLTYRDYFNVYTAYALSNESGIGMVNTLRDNKFGTNCGETEENRITFDFDKALFYCVDNTDVTEDDIPNLTCIVVANSDMYEGVAIMYPNNAGVALCPKSKEAFPNDARGLVQHEACGHAFGKMADEYVYHNTFIQTCSCLCCAHVESLQYMHDNGWGMNLSLSGKYNKVPWQHLINDNRFNDIVDVYEGGYFHQLGVYRSEYDSCMNHNIPYFSTWSRELIVKRIMDLSGNAFQYEDFVANDSRDWGMDFTKTAGVNNNGLYIRMEPREHNEPILSQTNPIRPQ